LGRRLRRDGNRENDDGEKRASDYSHGALLFE
jgi:hypothetical protein